jgi:hypothetical protein
MEVSKDVTETGSLPHTILTKLFNIRGSTGSTLTYGAAAITTNSANVADYASGNLKVAVFTSLGHIRG